MGRLAIPAWILLIPLLLLGCKHAGDLPTVKRQQRERDQFETLQSDLEKATKELEELRAREVERRASELGVPTTRELLADLAATSALLAQGRSQIEAEQTQAADSVLRRAGDVIAFASARLPRAQLAVRLARAASALSTGRGDGGAASDRALESARLDVEDARTLAAGARSRPMHVDIEADLQKLLETLDKGDVNQAEADITSLLQSKLAPTESEAPLSRAKWDIEAAVEALARSGLPAATAWVADAESAVGKLVSDLEGGEAAGGEGQTGQPTTQPTAPTGASSGAQPAPSGGASTQTPEPAAPSQSASGGRQQPGSAAAGAAKPGD